MENNTPTIREVLTEKSEPLSFKKLHNMVVNGKELITVAEAEAAAIQFAKLHCEAQLKAILKKLPYDDKMNKDILLMDTITNAYGLDNVK